MSEIRKAKRVRDQEGKVLGGQPERKGKRTLDTIEKGEKSRTLPGRGVRNGNRRQVRKGGGDRRHKLGVNRVV